MVHTLHDRSMAITSHAAPSRALSTLHSDPRHLLGNRNGIPGNRSQFRSADPHGLLLGMRELFSTRLGWGRVSTTLHLDRSLTDYFSSRMERVEDYLDLPQERTDGILPPAWWPSETASIVVENLVIQ